MELVPFRTGAFPVILSINQWGIQPITIAPSSNQKTRTHSLGARHGPHLLSDRINSQLGTLGKSERYFLCRQPGAHQDAIPLTEPANSSSALSLFHTVTTETILVNSPVYCMAAELTAPKQNPIFDFRTSIRPRGQFSAIFPLSTDQSGPRVARHSGTDGATEQNLEPLSLQKSPAPSTWHPSDGESQLAATVTPRPALHSAAHRRQWIIA